MFIHHSSRAEKILLAADSLEQQGETPFSAERLIVTAWEMFPHELGLKGYVNLHPDSNKVITYIVGERGLVRRGYLTKRGEKVYALSKEGRRHLRQFAGLQDWPTPLTVELDNFISGLLASPTLHKYEHSRQGLTLADACSFWSIGKRSDSAKWQRIQTHFELLKVGLAHVLHGGTIKLHDDRMVAANELTHLIDVHECLVDRFGRQLQILHNAKLIETKR